MSTDAQQTTAPVHSREFLKRRTLNWIVLGASYAAYYMARYNLAIADKTIGDALGFDRTRMGDLKGIGKAVYGTSALLNGPLADRLGGKRTLLIGLMGTFVASLIFGACAFLPIRGGWIFGVLAAAWALNNYFQSYGALSIVKVNAAWFHLRERGTFSGIFGGMIQSGRLLVWALGLLALGMAVPWPWLFLVPGIILLVFHFLAKRFVENSPKDAGLGDLDVADASSGDTDEKPGVLAIVKRVFTNRAMLTIALAEFCTGFVRNGTDEWFPRYMQEVYTVNLKDPKLLLTAIGAPISAICGGLICGWVSDRFFASRRAPVALFAYVGQATCMLFLGRVSSMGEAGLMLVVNSFFVQGTHGLLTGVASMDFGGKKGAATAAGFFDGCQYFAGAVGGFAIGRLVTSYGWGAWPPLLAAFAALGAILMATMWNARPGRSGH